MNSGNDDEYLARIAANCEKMLRVERELCELIPAIAENRMLLMYVRDLATDGTLNKQFIERYKREINAYIKYFKTRDEEQKKPGILCGIFSSLGYPKDVKLRAAAARIAQIASPGSNIELSQEEESALSQGRLGKITKKYAQKDDEENKFKLELPSLVDIIKKIPGK